MLNLLIIFPATLFLVVVGVIVMKPAPVEHRAVLATLEPTYHPGQDFNDYWYANKGELNRYELTQARYGEIRQGEAVLVFVTEHLDPEKHIKAYNEDNTDIPVMKLNHTRKFYTGIYPYSTMTSVFTPVNLTDNPSTLRANFSGQEWCGHVWSMLDLKGTQYRGNVHSYFPDEGDYGVTLDNVLLEDEVFNRLRIDPESLPEGEISIIPPLMHLRLLHKEFRIYHADVTRRPSTKGHSLMEYEINYTDLDRQVVVYYDEEFPRQITGWEETYRDGFGENARQLTTAATLTHTITLDYWSHNSEADSVYRDQLGLTER